MSEKITTSRHERTASGSGKAAVEPGVRSARDAIGHDENLLERARAQWQFGDWESLSRLTSDELQTNPDRAALAVLAAAGRLQLDQVGDAKQFIQLAREWGAGRKSICEILAAGVHNNLGRAAAIDNQTARALKHFEIAIGTGAPGSDVKLFTQARIAEQLDQLGLPALESAREATADTPEAATIADSTLSVQIQAALEDTPDAPLLLIAAAEVSQRNGDLGNAIRYWQRLAAVEGAEMDQAYYERLAQAYKRIKSFPLATTEEEALLGDTDKYQMLERIHQGLQPANYLEIGVQMGKSLSLAACPAIGVDPAPMIAAPSSDRAQLVRTTSDQFFAEQASDLIREPIDMAFIDGMHLFEYALRDFMNVERYAGPHTLVVVDDILPAAPAQAARDRRTRAWTGDVWKLLHILRQRRPDLSLLLLNAYPTGLLCISGLNSESTALQKAYADIVAEWSGDVRVPDEILSRVGALQCEHSDLEILLKRLRAIRSETQSERR